jgi:hypothetical protein
MTNRAAKSSMVWIATISASLKCHSFKELYEHRLLLSAHLFNSVYSRFYQWGGGAEAFKSYRHHDGELCFGGGWFIVMAVLPGIGQISYHYEHEHWDLFKIPEVEKLPVPFEGHTGQDVLERLRQAL